MTKLYSVDIKIIGTAYIKAGSAKQAREMARNLKMEGLEVSGDPLISGLEYSHPDLPEISLSPAMTLYGPTGGVELVEGDIDE